MMDSAEREAILRREVGKVARDPGELEDVVMRLKRIWQDDHQDTHERAYSDGAEGVMA